MRLLENAFTRGIEESVAYVMTQRSLPVVPIRKVRGRKVEIIFPEDQTFCHLNQSLLSVPQNNLAEALGKE